MVSVEKHGSYKIQIPGWYIQRETSDEIKLFGWNVRSNLQLRHNYNKNEIKKIDRNCTIYVWCKYQEIIIKYKMSKWKKLFLM